VIGTCRCGKQFESGTHNRKYCDDCKHEAHLEASRIWGRKHPERNGLMIDLRVCKFIGYEKKEMSVDEEVWRDCLVGRQLAFGHVKQSVKDNEGKDDCFPSGMLLDVEGEKYVIRGKKVLPLTSA
jgi:hypothetical protein